MLTREGFVAADMSAQTPLQRSSWKAEAIRRGDLKISGPIPITEHVPLNDEEEKEYAENGGLDRSLQLQDALEEQIVRPATPPQASQPPPSVPAQASALRSNPVDEQPHPQEDLPESHHSVSPPTMRHVDVVQRESVVQPSSYTSPTPLRSTPESTTNAAQKKRKSGLRGVFRKMFGRKSRDEHENQEGEASRRGHSYHHSDPGMLRQSLPKEQKPSSRTRISELPVEEPQPLHPLGQHLPFPMNVNAPQASPPHEYLTFDNPRRATLPSIPSAINHRHSLDESRGRLSTFEERLDEEPLPSPGIGIALSSPSQAMTPTRHKRRSRSADALRDLVKDRDSVDRGHSIELRHWRASYMSGSIYSRPQTAKTVETIRSVQAQEPTIQERESAPVNEMSATLGHADEPETPDSDERQREVEREIQPPVSTFNFGNLKSEPKVEEKVPDPEEEVPPPPMRSQNRLSIEDRVQHLENAYESLEGSIRRISTRNNRQTIILENAPKNLRTRNRSTSRSASASRSRSTTLSIHQEPIHQSSSDTLNPEPGSPILLHPIGGTVQGEQTNREALKTMYEALKHERSARKALEHQVRTLQHDVSDLHLLINKLIASATATSPSYPTPSPDTLIISSNEERLLTPRAEHHNDVRESVLSKFSRSETGSESEYDDNDNDNHARLQQSNSYDDVQTPDVWATPKEEGFGGSGFFHDVERSAYT